MKIHRHLIPAVRLLLASLLLLIPTVTRAQIAVQAWVQCYNGPGNDIDSADAIAVDGSNNIIVTEHSAGSGSFWDYATIKYSSAGVPVWTNRYNGPGNGDDQPYAVAVDGSNNVIVTGYSDVSGSGQDGYDYLTIKYSGAGVPLWTNRYNGPGNGDDQPHAVAVDRSNNVIVTGYSYNGANYDYATIQYSSAGVPLWTNFYNGPGNDSDYARAAAVDGSNNVIVTGSSYANGASNPDYVTIKYSSAGVSLWTNRYNGPGNSADGAAAVAVDGSNNVIVTGYSIGIGSSWDCTTIKYSSTGVPLWTNRYNGPGNSTDGASAVVVDGSNNVIVTGYSAASGTVQFNYDYLTIQYSSAGVPLWTNRYNGPGNGNDQATAVAVDRSGNVVVTGYSWNGTNYDFATIKYVLPPVVIGLTQSDGAFQLQLDDPAQAPSLVVEASTDLAGWSPVFTNTTPTNLLFYSDPETSSYLWRFYRASQRW